MCTPAPTSLCMLHSTRQHARGTAESLMTTADSDSANGCASLGGWVNSRLTHCCGVSFLFPFAHCPNHSLTFPVKASTTAVTGTFVALSSRLPVLVCPFTQAHTYTRWCRCVHVRCARPENSPFTACRQTAPSCMKRVEAPPSAARTGALRHQCVAVLLSSAFVLCVVVQLHLLQRHASSFALSCAISLALLPPPPHPPTHAHTHHHHHHTAPLPTHGGARATPNFVGRPPVYSCDDNVTGTVAEP